MTTDAIRRIDEMNSEELQQVISAAVDATLKSRSSIDAETHRSHHDFVSQQIERQQLCRTNRQKIINGMVMAFGIMLLSGLAMWMWNHFITDVRSPVVGTK